MSEETKYPKIPDVVTEQDKGRCAPAPGSAVAAAAALGTTLSQDQKELLLVLCGQAMELGATREQLAPFYAVSLIGWKPQNDRGQR